MRTVRNYNKLVNEILNLPIPFNFEIIGYVQYEEIYPIIGMTSLSKTARKNIVIVSGQHGEEYYAVHVLLRWMSQVRVEDYPDFNFHIFPIANPFGYSKNTRKNGVRQLVNNANKFYKGSDVPELAILFDNIPNSLDLYLDIHGDTSKSGIYCYERKPNDKPSLAGKALVDNDEVLEYEKTTRLYGDLLKDGVIYTDDHDVGIEGRLTDLGAEYTITLELPGKAEGQQRLAGGIAVINSILTNFKELIK